MALEKNPTTGLIVDLFGPTLELLTSPDDEQSDFCVLRGTIPPRFAVPLHSHPDAEDFVIVSGALEGLRHDGTGYFWVAAKAGDFLHVPAGARHAWRNVSDQPVVCLIITTRRLGRFFREAGRPLEAASRPPTRAELVRFATLAAQYGHWNATAAENAAVGIPLPS